MAEHRRLLAQPAHLAARFVTSLSSKPPSAADQEWAASHLLDGEAALFMQMSNQDRRHSIKVARRFVETRRPVTRAEIAGALLHDVGKTESGLGTWGRVLASIVGPRTSRLRSYLDHEQRGAEMAAAVGSDPATVDLIAARGPAIEALNQSDRA